MAAAGFLSGLTRRELTQFGIITAIAVLAVVLHQAHVDPKVIFVVSGIAVAGMAHILGVATEQAGELAGPRISALLNATFGNAAELIIVVLAIRQGGQLIDVARYSIIGSVLGNVLLILGASVLIGGLRHGRQVFNRAANSINATMLLLATAALALPTLFAYVEATHQDSVIGVSHGVAIVMALLYVIYLIHAFRSPEVSGAAEGSAHWTPGLAVVVLILSAAVTGVLAELLVGAIEPTIEETGISPVFIGLIIVPIVGNVAEHFAAVKIAAKGDIDFAMSISYNSALQVALAVTAVAVFAGYLFGHELTLAFGPIEIAVLIAAAVIAAFIAVDGESEWIEGAGLLAIYAIAAIAFWYL